MLEFITAMSSGEPRVRTRDRIKAAAGLAIQQYTTPKSIKAETATRLLESVMPNEEVMPNVQTTSDNAMLNKPNFSLAIMGSSFRRFNARIGVVFVFQENLTHLLAWAQPTHTISLGLALTFLILNPMLIPAVPGVIALFGILIPAYLSRHPAPVAQSIPQLATSIDGPPLAPAKTIAPASDFSSDFMRNMRDLQNVMTDFADGHDAIVSIVAPATNFSDEARSTAIFLVIVFTCGALSLFSQFLPWQPLILSTTWILLGLGHPKVQVLVAEHYDSTIKPTTTSLRQQFEQWVARDIVLDAAAETREVEVFELQRRRGNASTTPRSPTGSAGVIEYEPWVFGPSSWEPRAPARVAGDRAKGTRFFEDVAAPEGWEWQSKKWVLDLDNKEWVEARMLGDVEVEMEGERWVYDIEDSADGLAPKRGEWRRRRWVRIVRRKVYRRSDLIKQVQTRKS